MDFVYSVARGEMFLRCCKDVEVLVAKGYSGYREYRNNPSFEARKALGPIPRGRWRIGPGVEHPRLGALAIPLEWESGLSVYGRSGFYIHGDNRAGDFTASNGCIVLGREHRQFIDYLCRWQGARALIVA